MRIVAIVFMALGIVNLWNGLPAFEEMTIGLLASIYSEVM